jgi:hypothetical protein
MVSKWTSIVNDSIRRSPTTVGPADAAEDRAAFLNTAFTSFSDVVDCCDAAERLDLSLVAIHIYSGGLSPLKAIIGKSHVSCCESFQIF